jgi:hypothetical protein
LSTVVVSWKTTIYFLADCINSTPPHRYFDHQFSGVYQKHAGDCYKENDKKRINISHFRLRQKRWKEKLENDNKRFIQSLV